MTLRFCAPLACASAIGLGCASGAGSMPNGSGGASGSGGPTTGTGGANPVDASSSGSGGGGGVPVGSGGSSSDAGGGGEAGSATDTNVAGDVPGCPPGALVCESFEKYAAGGDVTTGGWSKTEVSATVAVDATKAFAGTRALHLTGPGGAAKYAALIVRQGAPLFPIAGNSFYGRMMVWLTDAPAGVHFNNVIASGSIAGSTQLVKYGVGALMAKATAAYTVRNDPNAAPMVDCYLGGGAAMPAKRWVCLEWKFDGANNELHAWLDGTPAIDVAKTSGTCVVGAAPIWRAPTFADIQLGWFQNQPSTVPLEMWIDDIVIDSDQRIGCPAK